MKIVFIQCSIKKFFPLTQQQKQYHTIEIYNGYKSKNNKEIKI